MAETYLYYLLIPHATEPRLLLLHDDQLPTFTSTELRYWQLVDHVNRAADQLEGDFTTLRCLKTAYDDVNKQYIRYYALENHDPTWQPKQGRWVTREALGRLGAEQRAIAEAWFDWYGNAGQADVPWYRPGWFDQADAWIRATLKLDSKARVEQLRSWERSTILRADTGSSLVYFKAVPPMFSHEPKLVDWLHRAFPANFPEVLAIDAARGWMLMPNAGFMTLNLALRVEYWTKALRQLAELQIALAERTGDLLALGCPDRRLDTLAAGAAELFMHSGAELSGDGAPFTDEEMDKLRAHLPEYQNLCAELAECGIPYSLEHGDFWPGQVVLKGENYVFIDWSDSSISFPFFSMNFLEEDGVQLPDAPDALQQLRTAYLEPWTRFVPMERLQAIYGKAMKLSPLHHALIYHKHILPQMQVKWEMHNMLPYYLRGLVKPD